MKDRRLQFNGRCLRPREVLWSLILAAALSACSCCTWNIDPVDYEPAQPSDLPVSTPEAQGLERGLLDAAYCSASKLETLYSMLIIKNGYLIGEAYFNGASIDDVSPRQSITKSVTSALVGIAIDRGDLTGVEEKMLRFFPEYEDQVEDPRKEAITVQQLLQMRAGFPNEEEHTEYLDALFFTGSYYWKQHLVDFPLLDTPGSAFHYSNLTSHLLGVIVSRASGSDLMAYAQENLFSPLGAKVERWSADSDGYRMGCIEIGITARDMAKLGLLYLNGGDYAGEQVLPEWWVNATLQQYTRDITMGGWIVSRYGEFYDVGYGYQWWSARAGQHTFDYACGHGGNYIILLHDLNMIIVTTADPLKGPELAGAGGWQFEGPINRMVAELIRSLPSE